MKKGIICLDFDSTVCRFETLDRLLETAGHKIDIVRKYTDAAMNGKMDFNDSLLSRVSLLHGVAKDAIKAYTEHKLHRNDLTPGINLFLELCYELGYDVCIISGGFYDIINAYVERGFLNIDSNMIFANRFRYDSDIKLCGVLDGNMTQTNGKIETIKELRKTYSRIIMIGDGTTDLATEDVADFFIAFTGHVSRSNVIEKTHIKTDSFEWISSFLKKMESSKHEV